MAYLAELRRNWRPLLAATIGMGSGMSIVGVITTTIAPSMVADNHWDKAEFALAGSLSLITAFVFPFVGRMTDLIGVRTTALIGQVTLPLAYVAYSLMAGDLRAYLAIFFVQTLVCVTTTATVYTRLPIQYVHKARGLALAIVASGPAVSGIVIAPLLNDYVEHHGWRASYQAVAIFSAVAALVTYLLIPPKRTAEQPLVALPKRRARDDYPLIFRTPAFWILLVAMLLCNLPQTILQVQLKFLLLDKGVSGDSAGAMLATVSIGMLAGRFASGAALDRFSPYLVSFVTLGLPSIGLFILASSLHGPAVITGAIFCIGFAFGAEADIIAFLVARQFGVDIYSSVMGLLTAAMAFSTASGAALLSATMAWTGGFTLYLLIVGAAVLLGSVSLLLLAKISPSPARAKEMRVRPSQPGVP